MRQFIVISLILILSNGYSTGRDLCNTAKMVTSGISTGASFCVALYLTAGALKSLEQAFLNGSPSQIPFYALMGSTKTSAIALSALAFFMGKFTWNQLQNTRNYYKAN